MRRASDLLFGPRQPRPAGEKLISSLIEKRHWSEAWRLISQNDNPDNYYDLLYLALITDGAERDRENAFWSLAALGLIRDYASTIICQNNDGEGLLHWSEDTVLHLASGGEPVCGEEIENRGGPAQRGIWREGLQRRCQQCLAASYRFEETLESLSQFPFIDQRTIYRVINPEEAALRFIDSPDGEIFEREGLLLARRALAISAADWLDDNFNHWRRLVDGGGRRPERARVIELVEYSLDGQRDIARVKLVKSSKR